ncbi:MULTISPECIES: thioesterase II family protein [unclassified Streptomyces]|uniref:thioesterase II family protein n=1 Tax=unclassified Streptomyces TaxID=2593676 RepID=UPI00364C6666
MSESITKTGDWLRRYHPADAAPTRLVCFPHAGGSATYYFPVAQALSPAVDVLAVQYPGRQDRRTEAPIDDLFKLADILADELQPWTDRPLALFGHSLGATLAYEVALRLEAGGVDPVTLFASGRRAPSRHRENSTVYLSDDETLLDTIKALSGTSPELLEDDELLRSLLPAIRADYKAAETYRKLPGTPQLRCPVITLTGDVDPEVTRAEAEAWEGHTAGDFTLVEYAGGHFYLNEHAPSVIARIREVLVR